MLFTFYKTLRMTGKLNVCLYIPASKFHSSRISYRRRHALSPLTPDEELKIVDVVNTSSVEELKKYKIQANELKKLMAYRDKNGKFDTFNDVLLVQQIPTFIRLCESILFDKNVVRKRKSQSGSKSPITPVMDAHMKTITKKVLGLRVWGDRICWAMIDGNRNLRNWDSATFVHPSKSNIVPLINVIMKILSELPEADAYVMESDPYTSLNKLKNAALVVHLQRQQIITIIISILKAKHRTSTFYMMESRASAKRYNVYVGSEAVSADSLMSNFFAQTADSSNKISLSIDPKFKSQYLSKDSIVREQMNTVLLVTLTFVDLIKQK